MKQVIINKNIIVIYCLLLVFLCIDFYNKKEILLGQLKYQFANESIAFNLNKTLVTELKNNSITLLTNKKIHSLPKEIRTLKLKNNDEDFYFKFDTYYIENNKISFKGGFWLMNIPKVTNTPFEACIVKLPLSMRYGVKTAVISDSQLLWRGGKSFIKELYNENKKIELVGENEDVYGYPYTGGIMYNFQLAITNFTIIPESHLYIICLGTDSSTIDMSKTVDDYLLLLKYLKKRNPDSKTIIINLPKSRIKKRDDFNKRFNQNIKSALFCKEHIRIVDFYTITKEEGFKSAYVDNNHFKSYVYKQLVTQVNLEINELDIK